jgi:putative addiction module component (TIGR02574 family)
MTKLLINELQKLSVKNKIKVVQTLWDDIAEEQAMDSLSDEHKKILEQRIQKINSGKATFKPGYKAKPNSIEFFEFY